MNLIYTNSKVDPMEALMKECNLSIEPLNESFKDFFTNIGEKLARFAKWLKELAKKIISTIAQKLQLDKKFIMANKSGIEAGYDLISHSNAKLIGNNIYTLNTYNRWTKATESIKETGEEAFKVGFGFERLIDLLEDCANNRVTPETYSNIKYAKDFADKKDIEKEYADTIKVDGNIEYKKMKESLERIYSTSSGNIEWIPPEDIYKTIDSNIELAKKMSYNLEESSKYCNEYSMKISNIRFNKEFPYYKQLSEAALHAMSLLQDKIQAYASINAFNNKICSGVRSVCMNIAKIYIRYKGDQASIEPNAKFTIGQKQESSNESIINKDYSTYYLESIRFI